MVYARVTQSHSHKNELPHDILIKVFFSGADIWVLYGLMGHLRAYQFRKASQRERMNE